MPPLTQGLHDADRPAGKVKCEMASSLSPLCVHLCTNFSLNCCPGTMLVLYFRYADCFLAESLLEVRKAEFLD